MSKLRLNLLQGELIDRQTWLNLKNVIRVWGAFFVLMLIIALYQYSGTASLQGEYDVLNNKQNQLSAKLERLEDIIGNQTVLPSKQEQLKNLRFMLQNKQVIHRQLTDQTQVRVSGFANVMSELAAYHNQDISLQHISIVESDVNLYGKAKTAESVPKWLTGFEGSQFIAGKQFSQFNLEIQEDGTTHFIVSSNANTAGGQ